MDNETILSFFREKIKKPVNFKEIVILLGLNHKEARALKKALRNLVKQGEIVLTRKGLYGPAEDMNLVSGFYEAHKDGYGFVIMDKPGERDIFIPSWANAGAMNNDRVLVRVENWQKREGRIIRILHRVHQRISGKFITTKTGFFVKPKDRAINFDLIIPPKDRAGARNGDTVIAEIVSHPENRKPASGKIVKILSKPEDPLSEIEAIIEEFNLPSRFPPAVKEEAKFLYQKIPDNLPQQLRRKDLRSLNTITIDGERAKDFDDAVSIKLSPYGYTLFVHIADVGYFIKENSSLDLEARKRGTSVYFPDRVIPMLPKELSEDLCSLKPDVERFSFTVEMDFERNGALISSSFYPSLIKSNERMTYTSVRKILVDNDSTERKKYDYLLQDIELMSELCGLLRNKRLNRGSLDFDLPEPEIVLDVTGRPETILTAERNLAHMLIEEFMISANEAVASYLEKLGIPSLYRVHEEPDSVKMENLAKLLQAIIPSKRSGQNRNKTKIIKPSEISGILKTIKGRPEEEIIHSIILKSLKQARYSNQNVGHFGLASECYTHFTSPIRRYPDLVVHRILREVLYKKNLSDRRIKELDSILPDIAFSSSYTERLADKAERKVLDAMRVWFMKDKVGDEFDAKVTGITPYGLRARLKDFFVEGFLHVSYMTDDFYHYNEHNMTLYGRHTKRTFTIGKEIKVRIDRVDMEEKEIILDIVQSR